MQVQFFLPNLSMTTGLADPDLPASVWQACLLCAELYRQQQKVFVYCANQQDAEQVDEVLWRFDAHSFVPHNLAGEGPAWGAPVEISWQPPKNQRQVLINLTSTVPDFIHRFSQIIEFVPAAESDKDIARQKYKHYRQLGVTPQTVQAS